MKFINLTNVKLNNENIEFEFLYKNEFYDENMKVYFEDETKNKYYCNLLKAKNKVVYSYYNQECYATRVLIQFNLSSYGKMKIFLENEENLTELEIRNNKNELITESENPYIIFSDKYCVKIDQKCINFERRKTFDKVKYEVMKQIYGVKKYRKFFVLRFLKRKNPKYYLFNDRLLYGDDNAEELFKYINKNHAEIADKCYFVLDKKSDSISRIKNIGKVLKYGSFRHKLKFLNSRIILSSHSSYLGNCFNPFSIDEMEMYKDIINKKFVFLQHGIIMNDVREYLNRELSIADLFITTTRQEYEYIKSDDYMYKEENVVCTGLPRFDKLNNNEKEKVILISPTWRAMEKNAKFEDSEYYKTFKSLLTNERLKEILIKYSFKIKFLLHPVFTEYSELFYDLSDSNIEILEMNKVRYSDLFNECSMFITDYSSIHYDVAFQIKPIIYYQFDKEFFFKKHYKPGYFDYGKDGFGNVIETEDELVNEIEYYLKNNCQVRDEYKKIIENTFIYLDHNNSERVYNEVLKLDKNEDINYRFNDVH